MTTPEAPEQVEQTTRYFIGMVDGMRVSTSIGPARWTGPAMAVPLAAFGHGAAAIGEVLAADSPILYPVSETVWNEWNQDYPEDDAAEHVAQLWRDGDPAAKTALREQADRWPEMAAALDELVTARDMAVARSAVEAEAHADGPQ